MKLFRYLNGPLEARILIQRNYISTTTSTIIIIIIIITIEMFKIKLMNKSLFK